MFVNDMSPMSQAKSQSSPKAVAVGWLDSSHQFNKGPTPEEFRRKLGKLCLNPVLRTRGFHLCPFCDKNDVQGNGQIHVPHANGAVFVAPSLVWHYIVNHDYQPPNQFVEAVMAFDTDAIGVGQLSQSILKVADEPTSGNRDAFYKAFVKSRVGVRVPKEFGSIAPGDYITTAENSVSLLLARLSDGKPMLLVLADVDKLAKLEAGSSFMELDAKDVISMAVHNHTGIIVQASLYGRDAWAGIPEHDVGNLSNL